MTRKSSNVPRNVRFGVFTVNIKNAIFWDVMLPSLVDGHHYYRGTNFLHLLDRPDHTASYPRRLQINDQRISHQTMDSIPPVTDHLVILLYDYHMHDIIHIQSTNGNVSQHHIVLVNASALFWNHRQSLYLSKKSESVERISYSIRVALASCCWTIPLYTSSLFSTVWLYSYWTAASMASRNLSSLSTCNTHQDIRSCMPIEHQNE